MNYRNRIEARERERERESRGGERGKWMTMMMKKNR
jgi:hypothetical protein